MNEIPILMNAFSVQAILDGRKTQTRRVIDPQPDPAWAFCAPRLIGDKWSFGVLQTSGFNQQEWKSPYGQPGDRLWVREAWHLWSNATDWHVVSYSAEAEENGATVTTHAVKCERELKVLETRGSKAGRFMPREFSRITLEIVSVRVERVQEISSGDCVAEGIHPDLSPFRKAEFHELWDSINAKRGYGWSANPWVWAIEFERVG